MDSRLQTTRRLRWLDFFSLWLLRLLLLLWLAVGLGAGLLHGVIVPRIGEFLPLLEQQAAKALGAPVRIGSIRIEAKGLQARIELGDVRVQGPAQSGYEGLRLELVSATLSPHSLRHFGFDQLVLEQPVLDVRRTADGHLHVAGIDLFGTGAAVTHSEAAHWLLSQTEFVIRGGTVAWRDELNSLPPVLLKQVDGVLRNPGRRHLLRVDASLAEPGGGRFSLQGNFQQPLFSLYNDIYKDWSGEAFADLGSIDMARLVPFVALSVPGLPQATGQAGLRAWADIRRGRVLSATADVALQQAGFSALAIDALTVRLEAKRLPIAEGAFAVATQGLAFQLPAFPGVQQTGNFALEHQPANAGVGAQTQLKAGQLDIAVWSRLAQSLPFKPVLLAQLQALAPVGKLQTLEARWQSASKYSIKAQASGLGMASAVAVPATRAVVNSAGVSVEVPRPGRPGFAGVNAVLQATQEGGQAKVQMQSGLLDLPGVFAEPQVPLDRLNADVRWSIGQGTPHQRPAIVVQVKNLSFANADTQGQANISWHTGLDAAVIPLTSADSSSRFPGTLKVEGNLSRADGARVWRYLPQVLPEQTRRYVQNAVVRGALTNVAFIVQGPVAKIPFNAEPDSGVFKISAQVDGGELAYVPPLIQPLGSLGWPALTGVRGKLLFNQASLEIENISASGVAGFPEMRVERASARIASMVKDAVVEVDAELRGPLASAIGFVNTSPLSNMTGQALAGASVTNRADVRFKLKLPLKALADTQVEGSVLLAGNDITPVPGVPVLAGARGTVLFSEKGFSVSGVKARVLGGEVQIDGNSVRTPGSTGLGVFFKAQGTATAEALRQLLEQQAVQGNKVGETAQLLQRLARHASGSTTYIASIKSSAAGAGRQDVLVSSNLLGLALALPEPLGKTAALEMPLRFEKLALPGPGPGRSEKITLDINRSIALSLLQTTDPANAQQTLRGSLAVGLQEGEFAPALPLPQVPQGVVIPGIAANIRLKTLDMDAWQKALAPAPGQTGLSTTAPSSDTSALSQAQAALSAVGFPTSLALQVDELVLEGYRLHGVTMGASRSAAAWRANMQADELAGYAEYRFPSGNNDKGDKGDKAASQDVGQIYARLQRLKLATDTASQVENSLSSPIANHLSSSLPVSLPALDIAIENLELRGKKLGRIEIDASNTPVAGNAVGREWRLNRFNAHMPEAVFNASGNWKASAAAGKALHRTALDFTLAIEDSGVLLTRLGMPGVVQRGKGVLKGSVQWSGSPLALDYPSLSGQMQIKVEEGQFLKADPGMAKLLGVLSLQSLPRRLALDFRDVFSSGFAFDFVRGDVAIDKGIASTRNMQMKGLNAAVLMEGFADTQRETQDLTVVVVPEINAGTASLIVTAINPLVGLGTFMAQWLLRRPLMEAATQTFHISGSWQDPKVVKVDKDGLVVQN